MKRAFVVLAVAAGWWGATPLRADPITPAVWTFTSAPSAGVITAGGSALPPPPTPAADAGASVVLEGKNSLHVGSAMPTGINFYTFNNTSSAFSVTPTGFSDTVFLRDLESGQSGSATFNFQLGGLVGPHAAYLSVVPTGPTTQQLHLGHFFYTITAQPFQAPLHANPYGGWLDFHVRVRHNPEPSTLLLAGLGLPAFAWARRRRRRAAARAK
jgi:hypothetical protein